MTVGDSWHGSEILWPRMDSDKATMKPRKFLEVGESWNLRMSSGDVIILVGVWNWKGGVMIGTFWD